jgi:pimeloyl-ACP methyl ester carboxylesterase
MKSRFILICLFALALLTSQSSQSQTKIAYGNNKEAGKYYHARGIEFYVEEYGNVSGKPLILIHGNGGSIASMSSIIPYFSKEYRVIAIDSRAHGKSTDPGDSLSFEMMGDDNAALLDLMHIDAAYVIGWSDGGIVALELAMRHPKKVIKLASTGANLWPDSTAIIPPLWRDEQHYYDSLHTHQFTTADEKNHWKIFVLDWLQPNVPLSELKKITSPSLIIAGDHDVITLEHTVKIYQNIPKAYLWIVPNSGHPTLIEHTEEFEQKVDEFFQQPFKKRS